MKGYNYILTQLDSSAEKAMFGDPSDPSCDCCYISSYPYRTGKWIP